MSARRFNPCKFLEKVALSMSGNQSNLNVKKKRALKELASFESIVVRQADKGGAVIILGLYIL